MHCEIQALRDDGYFWRTLKYYEGSSYTWDEVREDFKWHYQTAMFGQAGGWRGLRMVEHYHPRFADCPSYAAGQNGAHLCAIYVGVIESEYWISFWPKDNPRFNKVYINSPHWRDSRRPEWQ